jgi:hypothetical protein
MGCRINYTPKLLQLSRHLHKENQFSRAPQIPGSREGAKVAKKIKVYPLRFLRLGEGKVLP